MKKLHHSILLCFVIFNLSAQSFTVSSNKRFILKENKPFVWVGDTAWELFHALDRDSATYYLSKRASQGFTVIQAVALAEIDGLNSPNAYGDKPLINNDPTKPNEAYFKHVDFIIDKAAEVGLNIGLLPTWGDKIYKDRWGTGPEIFNAENAKVFGKWMAERYKNRKNIIWILGGDRNPRVGSQDVKIWRAMAEGVVEAYGGNDKVLITFHPQPNQAGASEWFHNDDWFDFNMFQTGHCRDNDVYNRIAGSYERPNTKPVVDGEPIYEDHPVCFNAKDLGTTNAYDVRKAIYLDVFAGAFGFTYGCHDVWQMYRPMSVPVNGPHLFWKEALELPAANQVKYLKNLIEARPILDRIPDQSLIVENNLSSYERIQATRGNDYAYIYAATGRSFTVNMGKITGKKIIANWFNPKNGQISEIGVFENVGIKKFTPPSSGYGHDWVLILDDASKKYVMP
ncbi:MAG: glycoside hydrolase family 140 protein [Emticicia sp.]|uniref:glycoside hydrolase family 140 protein n=1 Tax=Emticicia sp. TaxID=1930953 RepID=UPI003BA762F2